MEHRPEREVTADDDDVPNSRADAWVTLGVLAFMNLVLLAALLPT